MSKPDVNPCELLLNYVVEDCTAEEKRLFERHLRGCPACAEQVDSLKETWNELGLHIEEISPPPGLKEEVLAAVFREEEEGKAAPKLARQAGETERGGRASAATGAAGEHEPMRGREREIGAQHIASRSAASRRRLPGWAYAAAALLLVLAGAGVYRLYETPAAPHNKPAQVVQTFRLHSYDPNMAAAQGQAMLLREADGERLVLNLSGLAATENGQAYQVWLIKDGQRVNAGTFQVDAQGYGGLVYHLKPSDRPFDNIGITLEPDANGNAPRGKKVLGT